MIIILIIPYMEEELFDTKCNIVIYTYTGNATFEPPTFEPPTFEPLVPESATFEPPFMLCKYTYSNRG